MACQRGAWRRLHADCRSRCIDESIANAASVDPDHTAATEAAPDATGSKVGSMASSTDAGPTGNPASDSVGNPASGSSSRVATFRGGADPQEGTARVKSNRTGATGSAAAKIPPAASASVAAALPPKARTAVRRRATLAPSAVPGKASYQLQIVPWGVVYVDGVDHGVSPPLRRLALTPGRHTIRITNPKYRDTILEFESPQTTSNGKIIVEFADDPSKQSVRTTYAAGLRTHGRIADPAIMVPASRIFNRMVWTWSQRSFNSQVDALLQLRDAAISFKARSGYGHASSLGGKTLLQKSWRFLRQPGCAS